MDVFIAISLMMINFLYQFKAGMSMKNLARGNTGKKKE